MDAPYQILLSDYYNPRQRGHRTLNLERKKHKNNIDIYTFYSDCSKVKGNSNFKEVLVKTKMRLDQFLLLHISFSLMQGEVSGCLCGNSEPALTTPRSGGAASVFQHQSIFYPVADLTVWGPRANDTMGPSAEDGQT